MKKKLLSLVLAGAMVATTSVSAFATTTPAPTTTTETSIREGSDEQDVNINITGDVLDNKGNTKPGTINVTVPTAANFVVDNDGVLTSGDMVITNKSNEKIKVLAKKFEDSDGTENIEIVTKTQFDTDGSKAGNNRNKIWLRLEGSTNNLGLTSENNGKMYDTTYTDEKTEKSNYEIGKINPNDSMRLRLVGEGGTDGSNTAALRNEFKLVLKIARDRV